MTQDLTVICPWCNIRQMMELQGIHHIQTTDDFLEFLCKSCGKPFTIDKDWFESKIRSKYLGSMTKGV